VGALVGGGGVGGARGGLWHGFGCACPLSIFVHAIKLSLCMPSCHLCACPLAIFVLDLMPSLCLILSFMPCSQPLALLFWCSRLTACVLAHVLYSQLLALFSAWGCRAIEVPGICLRIAYWLESASCVSAGIYITIPRILHL